MGSARPELLKNKEALAAVTREAVILAEASGLDLPTATQALAKAMNQFNIPANEAARVINVLAAGSKEGAEAIPGLADAIKVMGTAAAMAGISLEQTVGMIETLAEKGLSGAESGTQLRNVILKLQSEADQFNPKVVGMSKALENLGKANYSAAKLTEMFGLRNQQAAAILIQNREKFEKYTQAVTGTTVAYEQQAKKVNTIKGHWKSFMSVLESAFLKGGQFRSMIINVIDYMAKMVPEIITRFRRFKNAIIGVINYFIDLYNESTFFRKAIEGIVFAFRTFKTIAKSTFDAIITMTRGAGQVLKDVFTGNWKEIGKHADEAFIQVYNDFKDMGEEISDYWENLMKNITSKEHIQSIKVVPTGEGGIAGAAETTIPAPAFKGRKIQVDIPEVTIEGLGIAKVELDKMNAAMAQGTQKALELANAESTMGNITIDVFSGMANAISDALGSTENVFKAFWKFFTDFIKGMIIKLVAATIAALALAVVLSALGLGGGIAAKATTATTQFGKLFQGGFKMIAGFQSGGVVPPGFPNDTFPAMLSSGEMVIPSDEVDRFRRGRHDLDIKFTGELGLRGEDLYWSIEEYKRRANNSY